MKQFGDLYSHYYDLLYRDKDYKKEVQYLEQLINNTPTGTMLDLGCGTGKHAELFCDKGYTVHGIDLSKDMLKIAETRRKERAEYLSFSHSSIQELNLGKKFNVVVSLFHVMCYQKTNKELIQALKVARNHLHKGGIFIFDFWYGPAVLLDLPVVRVKRLENESVKITRIAEPTLHVQESIVSINYNIFIENKKTSEIVKKEELHKVRYFFDIELEDICRQVGFEVENKYTWMSKKEPEKNSWNVVWVLRK